MRALSPLLIVVCFFLALPAGAQDFPALTGRVVDEANLLSAGQREGLETKLAALEAKTSDQLVVATVPSLGGYEIEDYGYRLGRAWGIGQARQNNGAILLVAPAERKVRIEVGYGLEGTLTDALTRTVIEGDILPLFRSGDFAGGIEAGTGTLVEILSGNGAAVAERAERLPPWERGTRNEDPRFLALWSLLFFGGWGFFLLLAFLAARRTGTYGTRTTRRGRNGRVVTTFGPTIGGMGGGGWSSSGGGGFSGGGGSFGGGGSSGSW
ncbi:TPM domain-containing protein [Aureimonas sp. ME7]|uniref:TPM domain-containing protein n=1 Tax=Aureimonas sp. ME7 TaxID=2744252 RepID=UPI0015F5CC44|nr:TPM domain-containing protein [Aureimonas sp. ME7]